MLTEKLKLDLIAGLVKDQAGFKTLARMVLDHEDPEGAYHLLASYFKSIAQNLPELIRLKLNLFKAIDQINYEKSQ